MHELGQKSASEASHTYSHTRTHTAPHLCCGLRYDAEPTASVVPIQRSPRICLPAGAGLQPWSYDIQPRIATLIIKRQTHSVRQPASTPCPSRPIPSPLPPLFLYLSLSSALSRILSTGPLTTMPCQRIGQDAHCLSDGQMSPQMSRVTLGHE